MKKQDETTRSHIQLWKTYYALDAILMSNPGLNLKRFAKRRDVSVRTVRRYLKVLEALGKKLRCERHESEYFWKYVDEYGEEDKVVPLFYCNYENGLPGFMTDFITEEYKYYHPSQQTLEDDEDYEPQKKLF